VLGGLARRGRYYYLRIVKVMYFDEPAPHLIIPLHARAVLRFVIFLLCFLGLSGR